MSDTQRINTALSVLSMSETVGVALLAEALPPSGVGKVNNADIAKKAELSRSLLNNVLRILTGAGIIETMSMGSKGTFVRTLIPGWQEAAKQKAAA